MTNPIPRVYHQTLNELTGTTWTDHEATLKRVHQQLKDENLLVHIIVLGYGNNPSRVTSTLATLRMLSEQVSAENVHVWLAHQGGETPQELTEYADKHGIKMLLAPDEENDDLCQIPRNGKTENILRSLKTIVDQDFLPPEQQFVTFLDDDYLLYDAINVHSLYMPWVMNPYKKDGISRSNLYIKGGGLRLRLNESTLREPWVRASGTPLKFAELCQESLRHADMDAGILEQASTLIPTRDALIETLSDSDISNLEYALDTTTQLGSRSSRALSCYLQTQRHNPIARFLGEFSFLLHGDQGTTLANWMDVSLAPGFGLELSFLMGAIQHPQNGVVNIMGLPHAHHPKSESENFAFGIDMFALMIRLMDSNTSLSQEPGVVEDSWPYFSPTKIGYENVTIHQQKEVQFYPPLREMIGGAK